MSFFSGAQQQGSVTAEFTKLRESWANSQRKVKESNMKHKALIDLTNHLSNGYVANLNVLVDVSRLLMDYRSFIEEIAKGLAGLDADMGHSVKPDDIKYLQQMTNQSLSKITTFFSNDLQKVQDALTAKQQPGVANALGAVRSEFDSINNQFKAFKGQAGGSKRRYSNHRIVFG
jgi:hypothetical protein